MLITTKGSPWNFRIMFLTWGIASRHGAHQVAQKSSKNNLALQAVHSDPGSVNGCEGKRRRHTSTSEVGLGNVAAGALRGNIIGRFHRDIVFKLLFGRVVLMQTC